jgi:UDP-glucose 4-epimerase
VRVLVTGGAGFLGSHLVDRLLAERHEVDVVDDLSSGSLANLAEARAVAAGALTVHTFDVRSPQLVDVLARRRPEAVFHVVTPRPETAPRELAEVTLVGTVNVLEAARACGASKVVAGLDALALYGEVASKELPIREGQPFQPRTLRGVIDSTVADLLAQYRAEHELEFTALALTTLYGPRQQPSRGVVTAVLSAAAEGKPAPLPGDLRDTRDLLYIDDAVDAFVRAGTRGSGLVVNVGTGVQTSLRELHRLCAGDLAPPPVVTASADHGPSRFALSPVRARIHLGWAAWTSLHDGLEATRRLIRPT